MFGRIVTVESGQMEIDGILLGSKMSIKSRPHEPEVLVLEKDGNKVLVRGWIAIKTKAH